MDSDPDPGVGCEGCGNETCETRRAQSLPKELRSVGGAVHCLSLKLHVAV